MTKTNRQLLLIAVLSTSVTGFCLPGSAYAQNASSGNQSQANSKTAEKQAEKADPIPDIPPPITQRPAVAVPGQPVEFLMPKQEANPPTASFGQQPVIVLDNGAQWRLLVGIGLATIPGNFVASVVNTDNSNFGIDFTVAPFAYPLIDTVKRTRGNRLLDLISKPAEKRRNKRPELPWSNLPPQLPLQYPAQGPWQQHFGHIDQPKADKQEQKQQITLVVDQAQSIVTPSDAVCLQIQEENGKFSVWLDHGMGLFSYISGLPNITIEEQDKIVRGAVIGLVTDDMTSGGQVVLQWQVVMNSVAVNPQIMTTLEPSEGS